MNQIFTAFRLAVGAANGRGCARHFLIALAIVAAGGTPVSPRQSGQTPTFRTRVDAVTVDVNATDAHGHPVTDLAATDFEVKENGKVQSINSFRRFTIDEAPTDVTPAPITSLDTQDREAARDDVRLIAVFLDDYHTRLGNAMVVREQLANFITRLDPRDMVAVMYPLTPSSLLTFSRDHEGTARAVRKFEGRKYDYTIRYPQEEIYARLTPQQIEDLRNRIVIEAVAGLNTVLGSFNDRRKTILMVSEGMASFLPLRDGEARANRQRVSRECCNGERGCHCKSRLAVQTGRSPEPDARHSHSCRPQQHVRLHVGSTRTPGLRV